MFKLPNFFLAIKEWFQKEKSELQEYVDFLQDTVSENGTRITRLNNELAEKDKIICAKVRIIEELLRFEKAYQSEIAELRNKVTQINKLNGDLDKLADIIKGLKDQIKSLCDINNSLKGDNATLLSAFNACHDLNVTLKIKESQVISECVRHKKDKLELYRKLGHAQDEIICLKHEFQLLKDKAGKSDVFAQIIGTVKKLGL